MNQNKSGSSHRSSSEEGSDNEAPKPGKRITNLLNAPYNQTVKKKNRLKESTIKFDLFIKIFKVFVSILVFLVVLGAGVLSKLSLLFMTSHVKQNAQVPFCNINQPEKEYIAIIPTTQRIAWLWCIFFAYSAPEFGVFFRSFRMCFFKTVPKLNYPIFMLVLLLETFHVIGLALLTVYILPNIDSIQGVMLTNCLCFIPGLLAPLARSYEEPKITKKYCLDGLAILAQVSGLLAWPVKYNTVQLWCIPAALFLISVHWWQNYVSKKSRYDVLEKDDNTTFKLLKQQISVVKSNYNLLKKPIKENLNETLALKYKVIELEKVIKNFGTESQTAFAEDKIKIQINEIATFILLKIIQIQRDQGIALSIIQSLRNHQLHPSVIKIKELSQLISNISRDFKINEDFLDVHHLEQIIRIDYFEYLDRILVKITIPLPETTNYNIYKIYLLPINLPNDTHSLLDIKSDFIASTEYKNDFILLTNSDFKQCKSIIKDFKSSLRICQQNSPKILSSTGNCLLELYHNPLKEQSSCKTKPFYFKNDIFVQMTKKNSWLYMLEHTRTLFIKCQDKKQETVDIIHQGIISFNTNCEIQTANLLLPVKGGRQEILEVFQPISHVEYPKWTFSKPFEYSKDKQNRKDLEISNKDVFNTEISLRNPALQNLERDLNLTEHERILRHQTHTIKFNAIITYSSFLVILAVIIFIIVCNCYLIKRLKRKFQLSRLMQRSNTKIIYKPQLTSPKVTTKIEVPNQKQENTFDNFETMSETPFNLA